MNDRADPAPAVAEQESFYQQVSMMWRAFMASPLRNSLLGLGAAIVAVIVATAFGQILLNRWNQPFYDALQRRDLAAFLHQLLVFAEIAGGLLVLNVAQTWLNQMIRLKLREGLTLDLIGEWLRPRRAFRLASAGAIGVNPDQRLHEDARHLTDLSTDLGIGLLQASILLASFIGVLWSLSAGFVFHVAGRDFAIPGYMVWAAILYAGSASWLSWLVGRPLIGLNGDRYAREAELRFSLMRVNEHVDAISLAAGEADEERRLQLDLAAVLAASRRILGATVRLTWVTAGYGWVTVVAPIVIAAPRLFRRRHELRRADDGGRRVQPGSCIAALVRRQHRRHRRLAGDAAACRRLSRRRAEGRRTAPGREADRLCRRRADHIGFDDVEVASPAGCIRLSEPACRNRPPASAS